MRPFTKDSWRGIIGEFIGTFIFVIFILGITINSVSYYGDKSPNHNIGSVLSGLCMGFITVGLVFAFIDISGAHFNPCVTWGFLVTGKIPLVTGLAYIVMQLLGAIAASGFIWTLFPNHHEGYGNLKQLIPVILPLTMSLWKSFFREMFYSFVLVFVIFCTAVDEPAPPRFIKVPLNEDDVESQMGRTTVPTAFDNSLNTTSLDGSAQVGGNSNLAAAPPGLPPNVSSTMKGSVGSTGGDRVQVYATPAPSKHHFAPIAIGLTIGALFLFTGSLANVAFNPARAFGAALVSGFWEHHWVFWVGDLLGATIGALLQTWMFSRARGIFSPSIAI